jgi:hypothetical protein
LSSLSWRLGQVGPIDDQDKHTLGSWWHSFLWYKDVAGLEILDQW